MSDTTYRALVVDDERLIRWSVGERLSRSGYSVDSADSGEEALEKITAAPPDLMLLDVRLPGIDGLTTLSRALVIHPDLIVLMMSAHSSVDTAVAAMKQGAIDFLVKPFPLQALDAAVERALTTAQARRQIASLTAERRGENTASGIIGDSAPMAQVRNTVARLAASETTTALIEGESGAGKEVVARAVHFSSARADRPFMQVNCAALVDQLLESELFGHERGAFTDAHTQKRGLVETAAGGSVFLDEIGDLPASGQAKLLQLLERKTFRRVGGVTELRADVRILAATNVGLEQRVTEGRFRADLFFRLNVVRIQVPPLREHPEDVPLLVAHFVARFNHDMRRQVRTVTPEAMELLSAYHWPGNVRQLRNVIERAFILYASAEELRPEHLPTELRDPKQSARPERPRDEPIELEAVEKKLIAQALDKSSGNQSKAARLLGVSRDTLRYRMRKHGLF